jgi:uncharacterized integral membrane protein
MWIIRYAIAAILIIALLGFAIENAHQTVEINIANKSYQHVRLIYVVYAAFCLGLVFWFIISIVQYFRMMKQVSEQRKKNRTLTQEITALRNLPLEEIDNIPGEETGSEETTHG